MFTILLRAPSEPQRSLARIDLFFIENSLRFFLKNGFLISKEFLCSNFSGGIDIFYEQCYHNQFPQYHRCLLATGATCFFFHYQEFYSLELWNGLHATIHHHQYHLVTYKRLGQTFESFSRSRPGKFCAH